MENWLIKKQQSIRDNSPASAAALFPPCLSLRVLPSHSVCLSACLSVSASASPSYSSTPPTLPLSIPPSLRLILSLHLSPFTPPGFWLIALQENLSVPHNILLLLSPLIVLASLILCITTFLWLWVFLSILFIYFLLCQRVCVAVRA